MRIDDLGGGEGMQRRHYAADDVLAIAMRLVRLERSQLCSQERKSPRWATMGREAVAGAIYELSIISYPELQRMLGHRSHASTLAQIVRFRREWPRHMRRSFLEAVLVQLDGLADAPKAYGPVPGSPVNPTVELMRRKAKRRTRRADIEAAFRGEPAR